MVLLKADGGIISSNPYFVNRFYMIFLKIYSARIILRIPSMLWKEGDMSMKSIWQQGDILPAFPALDRDIRTDVLIVGGGLTGLLCGYFLAAEGLECTVAEADRVMSGTSGRTTAKVTSQHGLIYTRLAERYGQETAALYYRANQEALERYRRLDIPCDMTEQSAFVYDRRDAAAPEAECSLVRRFGGQASMVYTLPLPFSVRGAVCFPRQAQLHPMLLAGGLLRPLTVYERTPVTVLDGGTAQTPGGRIRAEYVIVATHFPMLRMRGAYFMKLYQQRSYVLALRHTASLRGMYLDAAPGGLSLRSHGDTLLLGGGGHRTGTGSDGWTQLRQEAQRLFPGSGVLGQWAAQDCMTLDGIPYIGVYGPKQYVATGYGKWGMTSAMAAAALLTDLIQRRPSPYRALFAPDRSILHPQLLGNSLESVKGLVTPTVPRCPHLGCALKWNSRERSWDCPCHGSRFGADGALLEGPAQKGIPRSAGL